MTDPYRDSALEVPAEAPRDPGIVGDVIAQFADPKAFLRELVQSAIDALVNPPSAGRPRSHRSS